MSALFGSRRANEPPSDTVRPDGRPLRVLCALSEPLAVVAGWMGADRTAFLAILRVKLRLDLRVGGLKNPNKVSASGLALTCGLNHVFGWLLALFGMQLHDARALTALACAMLFVLLGMALVTDLVDLLLAPADVTILGALPVSPRTLLLARTGHALLYTGLIAASFASPTWIVGAFLFPAATWLPLFAAAAGLAALTTLLAITAVFALLLRVTHPERVRNAVLFAQIAASLVTFGGYYLLIGLLQSPSVSEWLRGEHMAQLLLPPYWFAALATATAPEPSTLHLGLMALALAVPALLGLAVLRLAGSNLLQRLAAMDEGGGPPVSDRPGPLRRLGRRLARPGLERAGFDLFLGLAARERQFRQRVYPMLAMPVIMMAYFGTSARHGDGSQQGALMCAYLPVVYSLSILHIIRFSDTPAAAWIYSVAPVEQYGMLVCGAVKALCFAFLLPWYLALYLCTGLFFGGLRIEDMAFSTLSVLAVTLWIARSLSADALPFTRTFRTSQSGSNFAMLLMVTPVIGIMVFVHVMLEDKPWIVVGLALVALVMVIVNTRRLRTLSLSPRALLETA